MWSSCSVTVERPESFCPTHKSNNSEARIIRTQNAWHMDGFVERGMAV